MQFRQIFARHQPPQQDPREPDCEGAPQAGVARIAQRKGMEKGIGKGQARLLKLLIQQRFGPLPEAVDARLRTAAPEQLDAWALQVLDAACLEEVFGLSENH